MEFALGQCVNHRSGMMPSIVIGRSRTERGREQYHVRQIELGPRRYHWMLADALVPMAGTETVCLGCRLKNACPMMMRSLDHGPADLGQVGADGWAETMSFNGLR
ncbi:hypothetical protein CO676_30195 [Sinorhizobium sp. BJ1]|nr:hypothetical protein CO676_30195 [Sinorhizobium sp. BJ1]